MSLTSINKLIKLNTIYHADLHTLLPRTARTAPLTDPPHTQPPTMTPFFLTSKSAHSTRRSLSTHENISTTTASYATKPYLTRLTEPSRYANYAAETRSLSLPPWFTDRPTRHAYTPSRSAEVAHRSLAYEIERSKVYGYSEYQAAYQPVSYEDLRARRVKTREAEYSALLREKRKEREEKVRVHRRGDELLYVRDKGRVGESGGWRRTEREVEWVRGRWA